MVDVVCIVFPFQKGFGMGTGRPFLTLKRNGRRLAGQTMLSPRQFAFIVFPIFLIFTSYTGSRDREADGIIEGKIYVMGNEPFTQLAVEQADGEVYVLFERSGGAASETARDARPTSLVADYQARKRKLTHC